MHLSAFLASAVLLFTECASPTQARTNDLLVYGRRAEAAASGISTLVTSIVTSKTHSATGISDVSSYTSFQQVQTTAQQNSTTSGISTSTAASGKNGTATCASSSTTASKTAAAAATTTSSSADALPIKPQITPAFCIAGVLMILTGIPFSMIGIRIGWLHIFSSASYLAALAVTVLIIYIMTPPIKSAVQGAYFVAACFTGISFGGVALLFRDLTEGLGSILGGFSLSMWFLVLKSGGLITSTTGSTIFILGMCGVMFLLYFVPHTDPYVLVCSTAISGATITIIGVDCFSRAGLREFWLWIWALNDDVFPKNTRTYPLTKAIKVEAIFIMIISILGIISQMRFWKTVGAKQQEKHAKRKEEERKREEDEASIGRKIEQRNAREKARWETIYGDKDDNSNRRLAHASNGSSNAAAISARDMRSTVANDCAESSNPSSPLPGIKMQRITLPCLPKSPPGNSSPDQQRSPSFAPPNASKEEANDNCECLQPEGPSQTRSLRTSTQTMQTTQTYPSRSSIRLSEETARTSINSCSNHSQNCAPVKQVDHPEPKIIPLPFTVPVLEDSDIESEKSSVMAFPESSDSLEDGKRSSGVSAIRWLFEERPAYAFEYDAEMTFVHRQPSRASSMAATAESEPNLDELSQHDCDRVESGQIRPEALRNEGVFQQSIDSKERSFGGPTACSKESGDQEVSEVSAFEPRRALSAHDSGPSTAMVAKDGALFRPSKSFKGRLPTQFSRVVSTYRTNEWAKHLDQAEKPGPASLEHFDSSEPSVQIQKQEPAATVDIDDLQQSATIVQPQPASCVRAETGREDRVMHEAHRSVNSNGFSRSSYEGQHTNPSISKTERPFSHRRSTSSTSSNSVTPTASPLPSPSAASPQTPRGLVQFATRNSSPQTVRMAVSPIREADEPDHGTRKPMLQNTLLGKRDEKMQSRSSKPESGYRTVLVESGGRKSRNGLDEEDDDNISLSERRRWIKQRRQSQSHHQLSSLRMSTPAVPAPALTAHTPVRRDGNFDANKRESMLASWRESMRQEMSTSKQADVEMNQRMTDMIVERQQKRMSQMQTTVAEMQRGAYLEGRMMGRDMQTLHRETLSRMQAKANRNA